MKKFSWEVEKTSLILRVTDGAKETTWKLRKNRMPGEISQVMEDIWVALQDTGMLGELANRLMPTAEEREEAWLDQTTTAVEADSEEASRAAQAARVKQLNQSAQWFNIDEAEESYGISIPDYDTGEI